MADISSITDRLPTGLAERLPSGLPDASGWFERNKAKIGGFAAGICLPIVISALVVVTWRGYGWGENPPSPPQVYTSF